MSKFSSHCIISGIECSILWRALRRRQQLVAWDCRCSAGRARRSGNFLCVGSGSQRCGGKKGKLMASRFVFMGNLPTLVATHLACSEHSPHQRRFDETAAREIYPSELADARRITYSLGDLVRSNFSRSSLPGQFCLHVATWTLVAALSESTCKRTPCKHRRGGAWKPLRVSTDRETLKDSMRPFRLGFQKSRG